MNKRKPSSLREQETAEEVPVENKLKRLKLQQDSSSASSSPETWSNGSTSDSLASGLEGQLVIGPLDQEFVPMDVEDDDAHNQYAAHQHQQQYQHHHQHSGREAQANGYGTINAILREMHFLRQWRKEHSTTHKSVGR